MRGFPWFAFLFGAWVLCGVLYVITGDTVYLLNGLFIACISGFFVIGYLLRRKDDK